MRRRACCIACSTLLAQATILYLNAQIAAGAQAVMLFDTWGGVLTPAAIPGVLAALHGADRRGTHARVRRAPRAQHRVHQGRRRVAAENRGDRLRRASASTGPRISRLRASGRRPGCAAGQPRSVGAVCCRPRRCAPRPCACSTATARGPATCSIWATASRPTSIRTASPCSSRRCARTRRLNRQA